MFNMLKKTLAAALVMTLLLTASALADTLRFGTVDATNSVNLRASASTGSKKLGSYKGDTWLRILGQNGNWYQVKGPDGVTGWMRSDYVYISAEAKGTIGVVDAPSGLTLRKSASASSASLGTYPDGTPCILLSETGSWYHVTVDGKAGYFDASYVDKKYMTYASDLATVVTDNGGSVNVRKGPDRDLYASLGTVKDGAIVMVLHKGEGWWKVSANGTVGYIDSDYLKDGVKTSTTVVPDDDDDEDMTTGGYSAWVKDTVSSLHLREYPSTTSKSLDTYPGGAQVYVLERGDNWCRVRVGGVVGYMATRYLVTEDPNAGENDAADSMTPAGYYARVKTSGSKLTLREAPSTSSRSLGGYPDGTLVWVVEKGSGWCKVNVDGKTGYMSTLYLRIVTEPDPGDDDDSDDEETILGYAQVRLSGTSKLHLREKASTNSASLGKYASGAMVEVLTRGTSWCKVRVDGKVGYMYTTYLSFNGLTSKPTMIVNHPDGTFVNLRSAPDKEDSTVIMQVPHGAKVDVLVYGKGWCQVEYKGTAGYMMTSFLDEE